MENKNRYHIAPLFDLPVYGYSADFSGLLRALFKINGPALALVGHRMLQGNIVLRVIGKILRKIVHLTYGIEIHPSAIIGERLLISHIGHVVIGKGVHIGANVTILHFCTLGVAGSGDNRGYPVIGDNVYLGVGAVVIGTIRIGDDVTIGASSVVTKNIPDRAICAGNPARILRYKEKGNSPSCVE